MFVFKKIALLLLLSLSAAVSYAGASNAQALFEVSVRVPDESTRVQRAAFTKGLQQVLIRLSGDSQVLQKLSLPPATRYVSQYRYDSLQAAEGDVGSTGENLLQLWMQFDAAKVAALLREHRLPLWSPQRDPMVVWLAVRDGGRHYLLKRGDVSLIKQAVEQVAAERGLPLVWPQYDDSDRRRLRFADVWAGFRQPLLEASKRYASGPVLVGNLAWSGNGWVSEWSMIDGDRERRRQYRNLDYATVISQAINHIADELGARYAVLEDDSQRPVQRALVAIEGIDNVQQYQRAQQLLRSLSAVRTAQLHELDQNLVAFELQLRTTPDDLLQRIGRHARLKPLPAAVAAAAPTPASPGGQTMAPLPVYRFQWLPASAP